MTEKQFLAIRKKNPYHPITIYANNKRLRVKFLDGIIREYEAYCQDYKRQIRQWQDRYHTLQQESRSK